MSFQKVTHPKLLAIIDQLKERGGLNDDALALADLVKNDPTAGHHLDLFLEHLTNLALNMPPACEPPNEGNESHPFAIWLKLLMGWAANNPGRCKAAFQQVAFRHAENEKKKSLK